MLIITRLRRRRLSCMRDVPVGILPPRLLRVFALRPLFSERVRRFSLLLLGVSPLLLFILSLELVGQFSLSALSLDCDLRPSTLLGFRRARFSLTPFLYHTFLFFRWRLHLFQGWRRALFPTSFYRWGGASFPGFPFSFQQYPFFGGLFFLFQSALPYLPP